jgi:hypothetical protein
MMFGLNGKRGHSAALAVQFEKYPLKRADISPAA